MPGAGPPQDPGAVRRGKRTAGMLLPAEGRAGEPPPWPLPRTRRDEREAAELADELAELPVRELKQRCRAEGLQVGGRKDDLVTRLVAHESGGDDDLEQTIWRQVWATPQAVAWERLGYLREVAQYVRWKARAELGEMEASKEARLLADRLGLHPMAMRHLGWTVVADEVGRAREEREDDTSPRRLRAVDPDAASG